MTARPAARARADARLLRVVDANLNRAREGLRVCEDVLRFVFEDPGATRGLRAIRHGVTEAAQALAPDLERLVGARRSDRDIGRGARAAGHPGITDVLLANLQRAKEALRVLEECARVLDGPASAAFEDLRFALYGWERRIIQRVSPVRGDR